MRQVPHYVVIGNGRMATHTCYYLNKLALNYRQWQRSSHSLAQLYDYLKTATHVLILINDDAIEDFITQHIADKHPQLLCIHFSGCLVIDKAFAAHPLQTFAAKEYYSLTEYQEIPFIIENEAPAFEALLPGFTNPHYRINKQDKPYYHAICVLANNFSTLLWQKFYSEMQIRFNIKQQDLMPFLIRTCQNIQKDPQNALTGPLARQDNKTLQKNLQALEKDLFYPIFKSVVTQFIQGACDE